MRRLALPALLAAACGHPAAQRPYPPPTAAEVARFVVDVRQRATSLKAETKSDFRLGGDRVNLTVYMLAAWGGKLRFQAVAPNESTAADLASDGTRYCFMDVNANCAECGKATPENVARLIRIPLEPDEVVAVLLGSAPLLDGDAAVEWDPGGNEILTLAKGGYRERVVLDGTDHRWDLLEAELVGPQGTSMWKIRHKDFHAVGAVRVPGASLFEQEGDTVRITWKDQTIGEPIAADKFQFTPPAGLKTCQRR